MFSKIREKINKLLGKKDFGFPVELYLKNELRSIIDDLNNLERSMIHHLEFVESLQKIIGQFLISNKKEDLQ